MNPDGAWREILDWYHLVENLCKVGGSLKRLAQGKEFLWQGRVEETINLFKSCRQKQAQNFCAYLEKHRRRIVNYEQLSTQKVCSIGSGAVESAVKQIDRRLKISGAQWLMKNVNQMLKLRCTLTDQYPFDSQKRKTGMLPSPPYQQDDFVLHP